MSERAKKLAHAVTGFHAGDRLVLLTLAHDAKPSTGDRSKLTAEQIRERTGLSTRAIRRSLGILVEYGQITREPTMPGGICITVVHPNPTIVGSKKPSAAQSKRKISPRLSRAVMERDAYRCVTCGTHVDLTCDHIIPESRGGPTSINNLQTMCRPCNLAKGARLPDE